MRIDLTVCGLDGVDRDVAVLARAPVPFADVRAALDRYGPAEGWCSGGRPLADTDLLGGPGLRCGDRLTLTPHAAEPAVRRIDVVGGIDAGRSLRGSRRSVVIGRDPGCDLQLRDPDVSRRHAQLAFTAAGVQVRDLGSTHGTTLGPERIAGPTGWDREHWLRVGDTHLARSTPRTGPAAARGEPDGSVVVRPRRRRHPAAAPVFDLPPRPSAVRRTATGWSAVLVPAVAGIGLALWTGSPAFLALALLSPLALLGVLTTERVAARRRERRARRQDAAVTARVEELLAAALREETTARRAAHPDAATVLAIAYGPLDRIWERTRGDPDLVAVRLGLTDAPAAVRVNRSGRSESAAKLRAVPATVNLGDGPLGLVGPRETIRRIAYWLVAQLAVLASPAEVRIDVRTADRAAWHWTRWLPHSRPEAPITVTVHDQVRCRAEAHGPAICLAENPADLPAGCVRVITVRNDVGTRLDVDGQTVLADAVDRDWAERVARALAPLVPAIAGEQTLPRACSLADLLGAADPNGIARRWAEGRDDAAAPVGLGVDGPAVLDLERHGPHLLIAGTTGSGKSELLRTLVTALACLHPPEEVSFVLIDYKGGAAFAECALLPSVAGLVTDLDEHLTARALASLGAELRRRERLFAAAGAPDLAAYRARGGLPPLPRLVIVVDEFAGLAAELPDFVTGLTGVAQRGRSLGLHLVLATQRPSGVVTAEVRANCAMRLALRVPDASDSRDVIGTPDAAAIPHDLPGRAYLWIDGAARPMQVARTDGPARTATGVVVRPLGPWRTLDAVPAPADTRSELSTYVDAVRVAAGSRAPVAPPWLPPLPDRVPLDALPAAAGRQVAIGVVDLPARQLQQPLALDLDGGCSLVVAGAPRTGRTSALVTIAVAAARCHPPDALHVHAIDLRGELVSRLAGLPHRGTLVGPADGLELADALLSELQQHAPAARMLLLVDAWELITRGNAGDDGCGTADKLISFVRAGGQGRTVVIAGDRSALSPHLTAAVTTRLLLRLPDRTDHALAGIPLAAVPAIQPPGRVLLAPAGTEAQLAYVPPSELGLLADRERTVPAAVRLRTLPIRVPVRELPDPAELVPFALAAPLCQPVGVPLAGGTRLLVTGPARSGRSSALVTLFHQAGRGRVPVTVLAPRRSPLLAAATSDGATTLTPDDDPSVVAGLGGVLLVDDAEDLADTPLDDALARWARHDSASAVVVAARSEDAARGYRGLIAEVRRSRCALLLRPAPPDGDLVGVRLGPVRGNPPPGRGILVGDPGWGPQYAAGPLRVQVAVAA